MMRTKRSVFTRQELVPIYETAIMICVADTMADTMDVVNLHHREAIRDQNTECAGRCTFSSDGRFSVCFERKGLDHRVVTHEIFHLTLLIAEYHGIQFELRNHEAMAYLSGWLGEWVYKMLEKAKAEVK